MRILDCWLISLTLPVSALGQAQPTAGAELVGTWLRTVPVQTRDGKQAAEVDTLAFRANGTWRIGYVTSIRLEQKDSIVSQWGNIGRLWSVAGDTLWLNPPAAPQNIQGKTVVIGALPNKFTLKGEGLTIVMPMAKGQTETYVYQRVSATPSWPKGRK